MRAYEKWKIKRDNMDLKIKICGMREPDNIREVSGLMPDYMGFIFYPGSKRYAGRLSPSDLKDLPHAIRKVAVFVNATREEILSTCQAFSIRILQLHGDEPPAFCRSFREAGFQVIKAFRVGEGLDMAAMERFVEVCDFLLLDASGEAFGGTGIKFDWRQLQRYTLELPFFLSGGLAPGDADRIMDMVIPQLYAVDLNSRFEIKPGLKEIEALEKFIRRIRT
jgi:phosphoribosylanthranilate isomerase